MRPDWFIYIYIYIYTHTKCQRFNFLLSNICIMKTKNLLSSIYKAISWWKWCRRLIDGCVGGTGRVCWVVVWRESRVRSSDDDGVPVLISTDINTGVDSELLWWKSAHICKGRILRAKSSERLERKWNGRFIIFVIKVTN